ncbi:hypothetical protein ERO13_A07G081400v2 [Gossypium hirsutum]|nr:hypothetical protein ERO13_A07G081400v2 [Gossypium hirsutum]
MATATVVHSGRSSPKKAILTIFLPRPWFETKTPKRPKNQRKPLDFAFSDCNKGSGWAVEEWW